MILWSPACFCSMPALQASPCRASLATAPLRCRPIDRGFARFRSGVAAIICRVLAPLLWILRLGSKTSVLPVCLVDRCRRGNKCSVEVAGARHTINSPQSIENASRRFPSPTLHGFCLCRRHRNGHRCVARRGTHAGGISSGSAACSGRQATQRLGARHAHCLRLPIFSAGTPSTGLSSKLPEVCKEIQQTPRHRWDVLCGFHEASASQLIAMRNEVAH
mmetsp:Transcript_4625/g.11186  ORF Transcript_4625/g.11186 Transcript_4625/m.11186 type:complete len:219 (+) Transcript_4625:2302-2958(+)